VDVDGRAAPVVGSEPMRNGAQLAANPWPCSPEPDASAPAHLRPSVIHLPGEVRPRPAAPGVIIPWNLRVLRSIFCFLSSLYSALAFFFNFNISIARFRFL
jgi:hypothetical protein